MKRKKLLLLLITFVICLQVVPLSVFANEIEGYVNTEWWLNKKQKQENRQQVPDPKGGPDFSERVRQPVSNIVLQQRYPNTIVLRGDATSNKVALTFDDGPDPRFTPLLLDVLKENNVKATFFLMGARAEVEPDLVKRIVAEGHIVGNHTFWHPNLVEVGDLATLETEVKKTEQVLEPLVSYKPKLFRAPYGFLYNELVEKLDELQYTVVGWSVDSLDWREMPAKEIAYNVISNTQLGSIILMHDGGEADADRTGTIEALREIIPTLQGQGLEFVTVPELLNIPYQK